MKLARRIGLVLLALAALRIALGLGAACLDRWTTPDFRAWVRATPAADEAWRDVVPAAAPLGEGVPWRWTREGGVAGAGASEPARAGRWRPTVEIRHGDEVLCDLELEVAFESREVAGWEDAGGPSEELTGLAVDLPRAVVDPDLRLVVVLTFDRLSRYARGGAEVLDPRGPTVQLDAFLLAGAGPTRVLVQSSPTALPGREAPLVGKRFDLGFGPLRALLGLVLPIEALPAAGLALHARCRLHPWWNRTPGGGSSSAGFRRWRVGETTRRYSLRYRLESKSTAPFERPGHFAVRRTTELTRTLSWNGRFR